MLAHELRKQVAVGALLILCALVVGGCASGVQLVSTRETASAEGWHQYVTPHPARDAVEEAVLAVAASKESRQVAGRRIDFIVTDYSKPEPVQCVAAVAAGTDKDALEKTVTHYRVINGLIAATSDAAQEYYLDANMERAILRAVALTWANDRVLDYQDGSKHYGLFSNAESNCSAMVRIYTGDTPGNPPIAERTVSFCFIR